MTANPEVVSPEEFTPVRPRTCRWTKEVFEDGSVGWNTECDDYHAENQFTRLDGYKFCMFCGGEIVK